MEKIQTPFGEIEVKDQKIEIPISDSPFGFKRTVTWEGISYLSESGHSAELTWFVKIKDESGELINHPDIKSQRLVTTIISSENKVTKQGITIKRENFEEGEDGENKFIKACESGLDEYNYYRSLINSLPLPQVISMSVQILDSYKTFDK